jgi:hypothetical protein
MSLDAGAPSGPNRIQTWSSRPTLRSAMEGCSLSSPWAWLLPNLRPWSAISSPRCWIRRQGESPLSHPSRGGTCRSIEWEAIAAAYGAPRQHRTTSAAAVELPRPPLRRQPGCGGTRQQRPHGARHTLPLHRQFWIWNVILKFCYLEQHIRDFCLLLSCLIERIYSHCLFLLVAEYKKWSGYKLSVLVLRLEKNINHLVGLYCERPAIILRHRRSILIRWYQISSWEILM